MNLEAILQAEKNQTKDIHEHLEFIRDTARGLNAKVILDLGVRNGCSTIALLCAAATTEGHVFSVDVCDCALAKRHITESGLAPYWTFTHGNDLDFARTFGGPADLIMIDTLHTRAHLSAELKAFSPKLRPGGVILIHDTISGPYSVSPEVGPEMLAAIADFLAAQPPGAWSFTNRENCYGLGVLTRQIPPERETGQ